MSPTDVRLSRQSFGILLLAVIAVAALCACSEQASPPYTCLPAPETAFPVAISRTSPLPMPLGQFLGKTRRENETLLTPQGARSLTGWVTYAPGFRIRYCGRHAVALQATLDVGAPWDEAAVWAGFQPAAAPTCQGAVCRWETGALCHGAQPVAATWNSATGELHVWRTQRPAAFWWLVAVGLALAIGWLLWRREQNRRLSE